MDGVFAPFCKDPNFGFSMIQLGRNLKQQKQTHTTNNEQTQDEDEECERIGIGPRSELGIFVVR